MDVAQLSYNLHQSSTIRKSPFEVAIRFQPCMLMDVLATSQLREGVSPAMYQSAKTRHELLDEAWESLEKANRQIKKYVDRDKRPLEY